MSTVDLLLDAIANSDHLRAKNDEWGAALQAADRESSLVLFASGALSEDDDFYKAVTRVWCTPAN